MRIAALSDFHIGARNRSDLFRHRDQDFVAFLGELEEQFDRIVLLGDVFQTEHGWGFGHRIAARELARAQRRVPGLMAKLMDDRYIYVHGNHDHVASSRMGARSRWRVQADGFAVYFVHGHQFDPLLQRIYPVARAATWASGRLRFAGLQRLPDWLEHRDAAIKAERFSGPRGPYGRAATELLRSEGVDAVIMGHTHVAERVELAGGIYANTGSCSRGKRMYVAVDTAARSVQLMRVD